MNRYVVLLLSVVVLAGGLIGLVALRPVEPAVVPPPILTTTAREPIAMKPIIAPPPADPRTPAPAASPGKDSPPTIANADEALEQVKRLAATFDEAYVPELGAYLSHQSKQVRRVARDALVLIGDASAVPYLQAAAAEVAKLPDTVAEAAVLREAAALLSAPRPPDDFKMPKQPLLGQSTHRVSERDHGASGKTE